MLEDNLLIVCPNNLKLSILKDLSKTDKIYDIKFMTKEEFRDNFYFKIDKDVAIFYLMKKYQYDIDVCKVYLNNLYIIDDDKTYHSEKLIFLQNLKKELNDNNFLHYNNNFSNVLKTRKVIVKGYYDLEKYEEDMLSTKIEVPQSTLNTFVYKCETLEEEINYIAMEIRKLINKNVPLNNIYLANVLEDDYYLLRKIFSYYKIPLNMPSTEKIYGTKAVSDFLKNDTLNEDYPLINKKIIEVLNDLVTIEDSPLKKLLLKDKLQNITLPSKEYSNAVRIVNLYNYTFTENDYVFVMGFNQDILPKTVTDVSFIEDNIKDEVPLYKTNYLNKRNKDTLIYLLSKINNLFLSYRLSSSFNTYYKSFLIDELNIEEKDPPIDTYTYSDTYNKIRLGIMLDKYSLYGEKANYLDELLSTYNISYATYDNTFTGVNQDTYLKHLDYPLKLSYTKLNTYNQCSFKYYLDYVLKLNTYEEEFYQYIGNMFHKILSVCHNKDFDLEKEYLKYLEKRELTIKEKILLVRIKKNLYELVDTIKKQDLLTGYDDNYFEKEVTIPLRKDIAVDLVGYIDRIMFYQKVDDYYFSIIDYKTGTIDTNITPLKYGLHMQLPIYLYLINYGKVFNNPIFTGIYYQNILFDYPTWSNKVNEQLEQRYYLNGYSTEDTSILESFDSTFTDSKLIKSLSYNDKGFNYHYKNKVISNDLMYNLIKYTKRKVDENVSSLLQADFSINPKNYATKEDACSYCPYKDICYKKDKDTIYLDKVEDLSFLEEEVY